ncbi:MAG TPA: YetF domain-containing protein [Kofleriaceae bacterium]|nr:YetF domain-containing protein [Kofleriaceae bacterium]
MPDLAAQPPLALAYYIGLVALFRLAGKRLAGQTTTFDLIVLISLAVVLQGVALRQGAANAVVFVVTVFAAHRLLASACARSPRLSHIVRGRARSLVIDGRVAHDALHEERITYDDLLAGLRKLGFSGPAEVRVAHLEETGQISAVGYDRPSGASPS